MVVPVLMTSCQVSEKPKTGPVNNPNHYHGHRHHECRSVTRRLRRSGSQIAENLGRALSSLGLVVVFAQGRSSSRGL